ncbi:MAG: hypothetical protein NDJ94_20745 [Vicinamibacteria bacterium]|nr:hypothetical protein [Vicinamibacteria bacterium]
MRHVLSADELPEQRDVEGRFSDLPITVFNGPRFYVDLDRVEELGTTRHLGVEENALGIVGWDDDHVFVFECLLRGQRVSDLGAEIATRYAGGVACSTFGGGPMLEVSSNFSVDSPLT